MTKVNEKIALITVTGGQFKEAGDVANHSQEVHISAPCSGKIHKLWVGVGDAFNEGDLLAEIEVCKHPALFNSLCVSCGDFVDPNRAAPVSSSTSNQAAGISDDTIRTPERLLQPSSAAAASSTNIPFYNKQLQLSASEAERYCILYVPSLH
jgi:pyruvate/2-oxoglutarate dehydrogenase complex dihydrolipoamide acyltransferase (E2) component